jgi:PAT family beta-lactamase induction signal transducer AmpG
MVRETYIAPITNFIQRYGRSGLILILLIGTYRISDIVLGVMSNVFYIDQGFTKDEIANIAKTFGLLMILLGGFLGGMLSVRYGVLRTLFLGAVLASGTNVLFALLAGAGHNVWMLTLVIAADNLAQGLATATFVAYLSSLTSIRFTATQYALFSSLMTLFPKLLAGYSGGLVDTFGYANFFLATAVAGVPVLGLILLASRIEEKPIED